MKIGDLVKRKPSEAPDGFCEVQNAEVGIVIDNLGLSSWGAKQTWAVHWPEDCLLDTLDRGCSVVYEEEIEVING